MLAGSFRPRQRVRWFARVAWGFAALSLLGACATHGDRLPGGKAGSAATARSVEQERLLDRVTWGATAAGLRDPKGWDATRFLERELHPDASLALPPQVQAQIDALTISGESVTEVVAGLEQQRKAFVTMADPGEKKAAQQAYQQELTRLGREAATRMLLRALYSPNQLQEQMTWF